MGPVDREIVLRAEDDDRASFRRGSAVLVVVGALVLAVVGLALLAGSTPRPGPMIHPRLGLLVTSRDGVLQVARPDGSDLRAISSKPMQLRSPRKLTDLPVPALSEIEWQLGAPSWLPDDSRIVVPNAPESVLSFLLVDPDGVARPVSLEDLGGPADWQSVW